MENIPPTAWVTEHAPRSRPARSPGPDQPQPRGVHALSPARREGARPHDPLCHWSPRWSVATRRRVWLWHNRRRVPLPAAARKPGPHSLWEMGARDSDASPAQFKPLRGSFRPGGPAAVCGCVPDATGPEDACWGADAGSPGSKCKASQQEGSQPSWVCRSRETGRNKGSRRADTETPPPSLTSPARASSPPGRGAGAGGAWRCSQDPCTVEHKRSPTPKG